MCNSKDSNVRSETVNLLEENINRILFDLHHNQILSDPPTREMEIKTKVKSMCGKINTILQSKINKLIN